MIQGDTRFYAVLHSEKLLVLTGGHRYSALSGELSEIFLCISLYLCFHTCPSVKHEEENSNYSKDQRSVCLKRQFIGQAEERNRLRSAFRSISGQSPSTIRRSSTSLPLSLSPSARTWALSPSSWAASTPWTWSALLHSGEHYSWGFANAFIWRRDHGIPVPSTTTTTQRITAAPATQSTSFRTYHCRRYCYSRCKFSVQNKCSERLKNDNLWHLSFWPSRLSLR